MVQKKPCYLGLDIGTDSGAYAVTDKEYNLLKFHGEPAWGVTIFDEASLNEERRAFRTARRRLDRRQQRLYLTQELFSKEIEKVDPRFFIRLKESALFREDAGDRFVLFNDQGYTDKEYYEEYPTIHHLIVDLMTDKTPHDVRLVYLACSWLMAHRGHFLSNIDKNNLSSVKDFDAVYDAFLAFFSANEFTAPWAAANRDLLSACLQKKLGVNAKYKELCSILLGGKKPTKLAADEQIVAEFPFSQEGIIKLLAGGTYKLKDLFGKEEYADLEIGSVSLGMDEEKFAQVMADIGEDYELIAVLRAIFDWAVLVDALGESACISEAKVCVYEQHKRDLAFLKYFIKTYKPEKYNEVFRIVGQDNYAAYAYHSEESNSASLEKKNKDDFSKFVLGIVKDVAVSKKDQSIYEDMLSRLELRTFLPKQKDTDNRVIPNQLYWYELNMILNNASTYLPFLNEADEDGLTVSNKLEAIFLFRIPYYVGPLNPNSRYAWLVKKAEGKIYPWNFEQMVDLDESENRFIARMTNTCTYLPGEDVLPKDSLLYHKFMVLNEINNLRVNGQKIAVELKQRIYNEVFLAKKKVTRKSLVEFLVANNVIAKGEENSVSGIDIEIKSNLAPQIAFKRLMQGGVLSEIEVEKIIERASYAEDKARLSKWLEKNFHQISEEDRKYICSLKIKDFGRLSRYFLAGLEGVDNTTRVNMTIISALWNTQNNLMEIIADENKFSFAQSIRDYRTDYYQEHKPTLANRMDEMYLSNAVRRSVYRTLAIVKDVTKAFGVPEIIFIEMTRGALEDQKGKRTKSRKQQILDLYEKVQNEDVRLLKQQLEEMGEYADNKLQSEKLFLYYMQLGKCMYTGKPIELEKLGNDKLYDIDHIWPQAYVKDDSIINNKVLCLAEANGKKSDKYPVEANIRAKQAGMWKVLRDNELISEEKYKRLVRSTPFTEEEKMGFINRQLTETSQATKAVATLLKEKYPNTEIIYCKARLASEFRQEFEICKARSFNDLHHAVDAYLNIVTGNVYHMRFTNKWFDVKSDYSVKTKTLFTHALVCGTETVWNGTNMLAKVKATAVKNNVHFTKYAFFKKGGLFDQMPVSAAAGLIPRKKGLLTEKYGGYNKAGIMFFIPVRYRSGKKTEVIIMSVELLHGQHFLEDAEFAREYCFDRINHIIGKKVDEVSFPMGMRPWKVNTCLSLDGFRVCIAGIGSGGKSLIAQPIMQFAAGPEWMFYVKKLERFVEKINQNPQYIYDEEYDIISRDKNAELYDLYQDKLENSVYSKRVNCPTELLRSGKEKFVSLSVQDQARALLNIHQVFGRISSGIDLSLIGGAKRAAATVNFSSTISNWAKNYKEVYIIDSSVSGIWEKKSENMLNLL